MPTTLNRSRQIALLAVLVLAVATAYARLRPMSVIEPDPGEDGPYCAECKWVAERGQVCVQTDCGTDLDAQAR